MTAQIDRPPPQVDPYVEADVRTAARALLRTPLLHADAHPDELALVRRHQNDLTTLFADGLGYRLIVEPALARLVKTGLRFDPVGGATPRPLRRRDDTPFSPRRYAMVALVLAALTRARRQLMVDELVAGVRSAAVDAGLDIDLDAIGDRRALHSALTALVDLGVLSERDGDLEHWAERRTESLLDVHRDRLAVLVAAPLATCTSPEDVLTVAAVPSSAGGARVAIRRILTEEPLLTAEDLTEEQSGWWSRNRRREREWFRTRLGLELEIRAEGAVAVDPDGDLTDYVFPGPGSARHVALLLLAELVEAVRGDDPAGEAGGGSAWRRLPMSAVHVAADRVVVTWRKGLRKGHQADPDAALADALDVLLAVGLVRRDDGGLWIHAAGARYAPRPEFVTRADPSGQGSLFEGEV